MNGHITGMIHSSYNIAEQLICSIDVTTTMCIIIIILLSDGPKSVEDEETLAILSDTQGIPCKNMLLLFPRTYIVLNWLITLLYTYR